MSKVITLARPSEIASIDDLENYYWMKSDLIKFCKNHQLPMQGIKFDLIARIRNYLSTGHRTNYKPKIKQDKKDSLQGITKNMLVKNYNNDAETRKFFVEHIGKNFKFNSYLRQFTDPDKILPNMTYSDLIVGWISFENDRKDSDKDHIIAPQFEYNQFIKDYFKNEENGTLKMAISAWKILISKKGPRTYKQFKKDAK